MKFIINKMMEIDELRENILYKSLYNEMKLCH